MACLLTISLLCLQGSGEGQVQLRVTYFPFELLYSKPRDASLVRPAFLSFLPQASLLSKCCELTTSSRDY